MNISNLPTRRVDFIDAPSIKEVRCPCGRWYWKAKFICPACRLNRLNGLRGNVEQRGADARARQHLPLGVRVADALRHAFGAAPPLRRRYPWPPVSPKDRELFHRDSTEYQKKHRVVRRVNVKG